MAKKKLEYKYMVSVDGTAAPMFEHDTLLEATKEAERLSTIVVGDRSIRVLRVEAVLQVKNEVIRTKNWI